MNKTSLYVFPSMTALADKFCPLPLQEIPFVNFYLEQREQLCKGKNWVISLNSPPFIITSEGKEITMKFPKIVLS